MNQEIITPDGSNTLFSQQYQQNFHDTKTGALSEALNKHVIPAFTYHEKQKHYKILDICYGLGYNTLATLYYVLQNNLKIHLEIVSPELDKQLIHSLKDFHYPSEFEPFKDIIQQLSETFSFENEYCRIDIVIGDARKVIQQIKDVDIVYQDAFSSEVNQELWTKEYFDDIFKCCKNSVVMTTYSIATPVRLSMYEAGFEIYEIKPIKKKQTIALKSKKDIDAKYIDMQLKQINNKEAKAIYDQ